MFCPKKAVTASVIILFALSFSGSAFPAFAQDKGEVPKPPALDAKMRVEVVKGIGELMVKLYIFPDKAKEIETLLAKKLQAGEYDQIDDVQAFARVLTDDLRSVSKDRHIRVIYGPEIVKRIRARESQSADDREKWRQQALREERKENFGFREVKLLDGNIGYLDLRGFSGFREAAETGIAPEIAVERDKALEKARTLALDKMMKAATDEEAKARLQWALNDVKAKAEPAKVEEAILKKYVGRYTEGEIALENGQLYVLTRGTKLRLIPLSPTYFVPEDDSEIQVEFVLDPEGKEYEAIGHFRDGEKERISRIKEEN